VHRNTKNGPTLGKKNLQILTWQIFQSSMAVMCVEEGYNSEEPMENSSIDLF
jgi:hypothetical protein